MHRNQNWGKMLNHPTPATNPAAIQMLVKYQMAWYYWSQTQNNVIYCNALKGWWLLTYLVSRFCIWIPFLSNTAALQWVIMTLPVFSFGKDVLGMCFNFTSWWLLRLSCLVLLNYTAMFFSFHPTYFHSKSTYSTYHILLWKDNGTVRVTNEI